MREIVRRAVEVYLAFSAAERTTFEYASVLKRLRAPEELVRERDAEVTEAAR